MPTSRKTKLKAGVVVYRTVDGGLPQVLLISARTHAGSWVFPVGTVKKGEPLDVAARRECAEESGYLVEIGDPLPEAIAAEGKNQVRFIFFLATVVGTAGDWERDRDQRWVETAELADSVPDLFRPVALAAADHLQHSDLGSGNFDREGR